MRTPAVDRIPSKIRTRRQAKRERSQLKRLISTGLFRGKIDMRRAPTPAAKRALLKFADVISGKAAIVKPADVKAFKRAGFRVSGDKVIIPKRRGERIFTSGGKVKSVRRTLRGTVKSEFISARAGTVLKRPKEPTQYAIPFNRGDHLEWSRHPSYDQLKAFMSEYARYKGWKKFAVSEKAAIRDELDFEDDEDLTIILEEKLGPQPGASGGRYQARKVRGVKRVRKQVAKARKKSRVARRKRRR